MKPIARCRNAVRRGILRELLVVIVGFGWPSAGMSQPAPPARERPTATTAPPAGSSSQQRPALTDAQIQELVRELGADAFHQRQTATYRLAQLGRPVERWLEPALTHGDPEVRWRAREVIQVVRAEEQEHLVSAFLSGEPIESPEALPGWLRLVEVLGNETAARVLYGHMIQEEWSFLEETASGNAAAAGAQLMQRTWELHQTLRERQTLPIGSVAAVLLIATRDDIVIANPGAVMTLCYRAESFNREIRTGALQPSLRLLLGKLVGKADDPSVLAQRLHFSLQYELREGLVPARETLSDRAGVPIWRQFAILTIAKMGSAEDLAILEKSLDDEAEIAAPHGVEGRQISTQVRDIALAALIQRTNGSFRDYGLPNVRADQVLPFQTVNIGFATNEERVAAITKWRERDKER